MAEDIAKLAQEVTMKKTAEEALITILKNYLEKKITECEDEIRIYEKKYGMNFEEFEKKIKDIKFLTKLEKKYGTIEVENDYFNWSGTVTDIQYLREKLEKLGKWV